MELTPATICLDRRRLRRLSGVELNMLAAWGWIGLGLLLTFGGAEAFVRAAASIAARFGVPALVIGLTIVAWGTSAPELVVSTMASLNDQGGIAVGNVVGSNIFNIAAIVGFAAIVYPMRVHAQLIRLDIPIMIGVSILLAALLADGAVSRIDAGAFLVGMVAYTVFSFRAGAAAEAPEVEQEFAKGNPREHRHLALDIALFVGGLLLLVFGSRALVTGAVSVASTLGVSETIIGLTIVAAGTSLPELATSSVAAIRKQPDIAIGNVVGSNIFNVLGILGLAGVIAPMQAPDLSRIDLGAMLVFAILLFPLARSGFVVKRWEGSVLLLGYAVYLWLMWPSS